MKKHRRNGSRKTSRSHADAARRGKKIQLHRLAVARSDIAVALDAARLVCERVSKMGDSLYVPLFVATVTAYARPFKRSEPYGALPADWSRFSNARSQKLHDDLIEARDTYVAHSDSGSRTVDIIPAGTSFRGHRAAGLSVAIKTTWWKVEFFPRIIAHCEDLFGRLDEETERLLHELFDGIAGVAINPFPLDPEDRL